jgi:SAM-dependent methyltransferase
MTRTEALELHDTAEQAARGEPNASKESGTKAFYRQHASDYFERTVDAQVQGMYGPFLELVPRAGRILDVGSGSGRDVKAFRDRGFDACGIDGSPELVGLAKAYIGDFFEVREFEEISYPQSFDGIWAFASLLHLPKKRLTPILARLRHALKPSGVILASVQLGDGEAVLSDGRYYSYYSAPDFIQAFCEAGFEVQHSWITDDTVRGPGGPKWVNVLGRRGVGPIERCRSAAS